MRLADVGRKRWGGMGAAGWRDSSFYFRLFFSIISFLCILIHSNCNICLFLHIYSSLVFIIFNCLKSLINTKYFPLLILFLIFRILLFFPNFCNLQYLAFVSKSEKSEERESYIRFSPKTARFCDFLPAFVNFSIHYSKKGPTFQSGHFRFYGQARGSA